MRLPSLHLHSPSSAVGPQARDKRSKTVVVGLSGGVDSSVAAARLKDEGYRVIGVYIKSWSEPVKGVEHCPWITDQLDARRVAAELNIPFYTVNFESEYKNRVVAPLLAGYAAGRTPNPDVLCNRFIKFDRFWRYAQSLGADFMATGHYARIGPRLTVGRGQKRAGESKSLVAGQAPANHVLRQGVDPKKDQSYFLWAIDWAILPQVLFPLGDSTKVTVRAEAKKRRLVTAEKRDSQGICFIGQANLRDFLRSHLGHRPVFQPGRVVNLAGDVVGGHAGAGYYTVGQKAGIDNIKTTDTTHRPVYYVVTTDAKRNEVVVGEEADMYRRELTAGDVNWLAARPVVGDRLTARLRHGQMLQPCVMVDVGAASLAMRFDTPQRAITPGQSIVLYAGDGVIGGGIIGHKIGGK